MIVRRVLWLLLWAPFVSHAQDVPATRNYLQGRDYYVLRSGNAQMIVQADQVDVGPAFTYLLFDAQWPAQSRKKANAFNFTPHNGTFSSAVGVKMKDFTFTPLAHTPTTRWIMENGIPAVEAVRWASGIKVREVITPAVLNGIFRRSMTLESADLVATDTATIKLSLHAPATWAKNEVLIWNNERASLAITVEGDGPSKISYAIINGVKIKPDRTGAIWVPKDFKSGNIQVINEIRGKINCSRLFATTVMANFLTIG